MCASRRQCPTSVSSMPRRGLLCCSLAGLGRPVAVIRAALAVAKATRVAAWNTADAGEGSLVTEELWAAVHVAPATPVTAWNTVDAGAGTLVSDEPWAAVPAAPATPVTAWDTVDAG